MQSSSEQPLVGEERYVTTRITAAKETNVCITYEKNKRKIPLGTSRGLKWENKTYKLKRSIAHF